MVKKAAKVKKAAPAKGAVRKSKKKPAKRKDDCWCFDRNGHEVKCPPGVPCGTHL